MFCVTVSIILSSKYRCILLLFVLEFVMNHKNETGNITTEKRFPRKLKNWSVHYTKTTEKQMLNPCPSFIEPPPFPDR